MKLDPEVYAKAKEAATALKIELEPMILGRKRPSFSCGCGAISKGESTAVEIVPAGLDPRYESQIGFWYMWSVKMREDNNPNLAPGDYSYSASLSFFVGPSVLTEMFQRHFAGKGVKVAK